MFANCPTTQNTLQGQVETGGFVGPKAIPSIGFCQQYLKGDKVQTVKPYAAHKKYTQNNKAKADDSDEGTPMEKQLMKENQSLKKQMKSMQMMFRNGGMTRGNMMRRI